MHFRIDIVLIYTILLENHAKEEAEKILILMIGMIRGENGPSFMSSSDNRGKRDT